MTAEPQSDKPTRIFLSYAAKDRAKADRLRRMLARKPEIEVYSDAPGVDAEKDWGAWMRKALDRSDLFLFLLTPNALGSSWALHELGAAWAMEKPIVTVASDPKLMRDIRPIPLHSLPSVRLDAMDDGAIGRLIDLRRKAAPPRARRVKQAQ